MPRNPLDISVTGTQRTQRRLAELDDQKETLRLGIGGAKGAEGKEGPPGKEGPEGKAGIEVFNVKTKYGAKGDGVTDDSSAIQLALTECAKAGGGIVFFPAGIYLINTTLEIDNFVTIWGAGAHVSVLKLGKEKNTSILKSKRYESGGETGGTEYTCYFDIGFDGNKAQNAASTEAVVKLDGIRPVMRGVFIKDGYDNLSSIMSRKVSEGTNKAEDGLFTNLEIFGSTHIAIKEEGPHDSQWDQVLVRVSEGIGIYSHGTSDQWSNVHVYGNATYGYHSLGGNIFKGCTSEGCTIADVWFIGASNRWYSGWIFASGAEDAKVGFLFGDATHEATGSFVDGVKIEGKLSGSFKFNHPAENSRISASVYQVSGEMVKEGEAKPSSTIDWDVQLSGGAKYGTVVEEGAGMSKTLGHLTTLGDLDIKKNRIALEKRESAPGSSGSTAKVYAIDAGFEERTALSAIMSAGNPVVLAVGTTGSPEVASAATLTINDAGPATTIEITGTTEITKITKTHPNHIIVLTFSSAGCAVKNGENLKLRENFTSVGTRSTLTLACLGSNWFEIGRDTYQKAEAPTALTSRAEATEFEPSATRTTLVTGRLETLALTRTLIKIEVGSTIVVEEEVSAAASGASVQTFCFAVPAGTKWKWTKIEGTVVAESFKTSYTVL